SRQSIEGRRVNEETARVFEQTVFEIEFAQRAAFGIARPRVLKFSAEAALTFNRTGQRRFVPEEQVLKKPFTGIGNALLWPIGRAGAGHFRIESVARFIIGDRDEVLHPDLMFEHQQSNDVAPWRQITGALKSIADIADDIRPPGGAEIELERMARIIDKDIAEVRIR